MAEAYRVLSDVSIPKPIRLLSDDEIAGKQYEVEGVTYSEGEVLLESDIVPNLREQADDDGLGGLIEPISRDEYDKAKDEAGRGEFSTFIPEHEAERVVLEEYGHRVVQRDQVLELGSAGAEDAKAAQEAAKGDGRDERPGLTASEVPSLVEVSNGDARAVVPREPGEPIPEDELEGVERPPGIPTGPDKARLEGGDGSTKPRSRPKAKAKRGSSEGSEGGQE